MKSTLPARSLPYKERLHKISDVIVNTAKDKIAFVILFGPFARGNWIQASDFDLLVITTSKRKENGDGISSFDLERKIQHELKHNSTNVIHKEHLIIEPLDYVNSELEKGRHFFSDILKEGILLYDSGQFKLTKPKILTDDEIKEMARKDYEHWFKSAEVFLSQCKNAYEIGEYKNAVFQLHQAAEHLYNCTLLVLTGYKPKSHDLIELNRLCSTQSNDFFNIFPNATNEEKACLKLFNKSYIDSRYNKHFTITKEQLEYLIQRVDVLKKVVNELCGEEGAKKFSLLTRQRNYSLFSANLEFDIRRKIQNSTTDTDLK